jgi:hypothetical protein
MECRGICFCVSMGLMRWKREKDGTLTYVGDQIKLQNGFGAWTPYIYECDFDPDGDRVLDVRGAPGRLR